MPTPTITVTARAAAQRTAASAAADQLDAPPRHAARWFAVLGAFPVLSVVVLLAAMGVFLGGSAPPTSAPAAVPGLDPTVLDAYTRAAAAAEANGCHLRWSVLAGIGEIESDNAAGHAVTSDGQITPPILGPVLDGSGTGGNTTPVRDTDHGQLDGDTQYDRAISLLQLLPATWTSNARDGDGDDHTDPDNAYDAAAAATAYLCGPTGANLTNPAQLRAALFKYNRSTDYVDRVLAAITRFDEQTVPPVPVTIAPNPAATTAIRVALAQLGKPYQWGATGPNAFDCSGLTSYAYAAAGIHLPRTSAEQYATGHHVGTTATGITGLQPGDLVFWAYNTADPSTVHHVAIYLGNNQIVEAYDTGVPVRIAYFQPSGYIGGSRPK